MSVPKETREFNGKAYVMEEAIFGDYAFVKVAKADRLGNCTFRKAQNNFNEAMGKNAKTTIVEADEIVEYGDIKPEDIHLQGIYVKKVIKSTAEKKIERLVFYKDPEEQKKALLEGGMDPPYNLLSKELLIGEQETLKPRRSANASSSEQHRSSRMVCTSISALACLLRPRHFFPRVSRSSWNRRTASLGWVAIPSLERRIQISSMLERRRSR